MLSFTCNFVLCYSHQTMLIMFYNDMCILLITIWVVITEFYYWNSQLLLQYLITFLNVFIHAIFSLIYYSCYSLRRLSYVIVKTDVARWEIN